MTDTRITFGQYRAISLKASKLGARICKLMDALEPPYPGDLPPEWDELHEMMKLAHVIAAQARRYATRAAEENEPAPDLTPLAAERLYVFDLAGDAFPDADLF
jgi:hypothetical protein